MNVTKLDRRSTRRIRPGRRVVVVRTPNTRLFSDAAAYAAIPTSVFLTPTRLAQYASMVFSDYAGTNSAQQHGLTPASNVEAA